jgi:CubicO group peptidase (beta-lactamase class C family)
MKFMNRYSVILFLLLPLQFAFSQKKYDFSSVDALIEKGIRDMAYPSAVLVVGNNKDIIYQNAYGRLTYEDDAKPTTMNTIYDLASVTKVIATTSAIMKLYDEGKIDLNATAASFIPDFGANGKDDITIMNLLLHNSGLPAWEPFYEKDTCAEQVRDEIYAIPKEYLTGTKTVYSDLGFVVLGDIVEKITGMKLDKFCKKNIFNPLNMTDTDFLIPESEDYRIAPTENDTYWRHQLLIGYVHDEIAALLEGISGNAGLFSTGPDLYKFMRAMLNRGIYIDERRVPAKNVYDTLFKPTTVDFFTSRVTGLGYANTRALGWDTKPEATTYPPPCGDRFSQNSFGHTGYTGTSVWCDKEKNLIVILLTNRIYPKRGNEEIKTIRPKVHDEICRVMGY